MVPSVLINKKEMITALETLLRKMRYERGALCKYDGIYPPRSWGARFLRIFYKQ